MVSAQQEFIPTAALMALPLTSSGLSGLNLVMVRALLLPRK